jgi:hypothetical protein
VTRERITAVVAVLAVVGMLRSAWLHFVSEPLHDFQRERIDPRFAAVKALLPPAGEIGYVSDERVGTGQPGSEVDLPGSKRFDQAQYALAPLVLLYEDQRAALVIADLRDPARLPEVARERRLVVVAQPAPGVALLRRP